MAELPDDTSPELLLRAYLQGRSVACPNCSYDLCNLETARCPECGSVLEIGVRLTEPRIGWLVAGLCGLVCGGGFSMLMVVYFFISMAVGRVPNGEIRNVFLIYAVLPAIVQGVLIGLYLRHWSPIRNMDAARRRLLVVACCLVPLVNITFFTIGVQ